MAIILLILHLSIFLSGSGINRKSSIKLTLVAAAKEGKNNNNNNNPVRTNVQCRKDDAGGPPRTRNNSLKLGRGNIAADSKNINMNGRCGNSDITTSRSSDIAADDSIIINSGPLRRRESRRRKEDLVRDPMVTLNSNGGDRELPTTDVTGAPAGATEAFMVSGIQNNINDGGSRNIATDDDSMKTIE